MERKNPTLLLVLDGWGRQDRHETLNSFVWGPDGWLYGLHGVFTHSKVGKPGTPERAGEMLRRLSGRTHQVVGGIAMRRDRYDASGVVRTRVTMRAMTDEEITAYVTTGEPLDKAGGYAIQGGGGDFVTGVDGCRDNVVGLSIGAVLEMLTMLGGQPPSRAGGSSL